jgi:hypothetical protein
LQDSGQVHLLQPAFPNLPAVCLDHKTEGILGNRTINISDLLGGTEGNVITIGIIQDFWIVVPSFQGIPVILGLGTELHRKAAAGLAFQSNIMLFQVWGIIPVKRHFYTRDHSILAK